MSPTARTPSYAQGLYDRDNDFYLKWDVLSREPAQVNAWLDEWVYGISGRAEYVRKLGEETITRLRPAPAPAAPVDYGVYR